MTKQQYGLFAINEIIRLSNLIESAKTSGGGYNMVDLDSALQEASQIKVLAEDTRNYMEELINPEYPDNQRALDYEHSTEIEGRYLKAI
jgi:hypothetical protein